jgi:hypothetical protein
MVDWKGNGMKKSQPNLRCHPGVLLGGTEEIHKLPYKEISEHK